MSANYKNWKRMLTPVVLAAVLMLTCSCMEAGVPVYNTTSEETADINDSKIDKTSSIEAVEISLVMPDIETDSSSWTERGHYFGSAEFMEGTTVIIAIFSDDLDFQWTDSLKDERMKGNMKRNLSTACDYLTACAGEYGREAEFYYDWEVYPELFYEASFDEHMVEQEGLYYNLEKEYIEQEIDTEGILTTFQARNVIYMFYFNTDFENSVRPWTFCHNQGEYYDNETINLFVRFDGVSSPSATIAHEILHCFGAPDYYYANDRIPVEYVEYCEENQCNDIMFSVNAGQRITREFSELTAYYVGLQSQCDTVNEWGLGVSERAEVIRERKESLGIYE